MSKDGEILDDVVIARQAGENIMAKKEEIDFVDLSPKQIVSVATACIPFLENDDGQRALMGANMQRQAIPLLQPHTPIVGTGLEKVAAKYSGLACLAEKAGTITYVDSTKIIAQNDDGTESTYELEKFARSNNGTCINQMRRLLG
jgi:DNA-directed RNA polymerase subunit beta